MQINFFVLPMSSIIVRWQSARILTKRIIKYDAYLQVHELVEDDDDDEVLRVCNTPGDPCGCTRQHSQSSGLPLPSPWIKHWSVFSS